MTPRRGPALDIEGAAAPPRRNGEFVFQEPWEGRAFGIALTLSDQGYFPWEAFRQRLIAAVARADRIPDARDRPAYYENWLAALQQLLVDRGVVSLAEIDRRADEFATGKRDIVNPGAR
jgi:nitrile hydratase accessory protein